MGAISSILMVVLMFAGGAGDLLSLNSTAAYWRAKGGMPSVEGLRAEIADSGKAGDVSAEIAKLGDTDFKVRQAAREVLAAKGNTIVDQLKVGATNKDPEIAATCRDLLTKASSNSQEKAVRKLMAIRTLGEMKDKESVAALTKLKESKEPFVGDYAGMALDAISGESHPRAAVDIKDDINLLPKDVGAVGQSSGIGGAMTIEKMLDANAALIVPQGGQMMEDARKEMVDRINGGLLPVMDMVGNVRLDGVTFGMSKQVGQNAGWVVLIARGEFDRDALVALIKDKMGGQMEVTEEDKVPTIRGQGQNQVIVLPSNHVAVMVVGALPDEVAAIGKEVAAAVKAGKGSFAENAEMAALLKGVDRTKDVWAVMQVPALFQAMAQPFAGIDTLVVAATHKESVVHYELKGTGTDAEKVKASAESMKSLLADGEAQMKNEIGQLQNNPGMGDGMKSEIAMMNQMVGMIEAIKIDSAEKTATMKGEFDLYQAVGMFLGEIRMTAPMPPPPPMQVQPMQQPMPR